MCPIKRLSSLLLFCCFINAQAAFLSSLTHKQKNLDFSENTFNQCLESQDYTVLEPMTYEFLEVQNKSKVFDHIERGIIEKKDPFCLYTYIRSKVMTKRNNGALSTAEIALILRNMLISLMLLAGDLACCTAFGDDSGERDKSYALLKDTYAHWFTKYLASEAPEFQSIQKLLSPWIKETTTIEQASPFWARYFHTDVIYYRWTIHFETPKPNELRAYRDQAIKDFISKKRLESQQDFLLTTQSCNDWGTFFKLRLLGSLNKKTLQLFIDGQPESQVPAASSKQLQINQDENDAQ